MQQQHEAQCPEVVFAVRLACHTALHISALHDLHHLAMTSNVRKGRGFWDGEQVHG